MDRNPIPTPTYTSRSSTLTHTIPTFIIGITIDTRADAYLAPSECRSHFSRCVNPL
jgi:hypothetical protein